MPCLHRKPEYRWSGRSDEVRYLKVPALGSSMKELNQHYFLPSSSLLHSQVSFLSDSQPAGGRQPSLEIKMHFLAVECDHQPCVPAELQGSEQWARGFSFSLPSFPAVQSPITLHTYWPEVDTCGSQRLGCWVQLFLKLFQKYLQTSKTSQSKPNAPNLKVTRT